MYQARPAATEVCTSVNHTPRSRLIAAPATAASARSAQTVATVSASAAAIETG